MKKLFAIINQEIDKITKVGWFETKQEAWVDWLSHVSAPKPNDFTVCEILGELSEDVPEEGHSSFLILNPDGGARVVFRLFTEEWAGTQIRAMTIKHCRYDELIYTFDDDEHIKEFKKLKNKTASKRCPKCGQQYFVYYVIDGDLKKHISDKIISWDYNHQKIKVNSLSTSINTHSLIEAFCSNCDAQLDYVSIAIYHAYYSRDNTIKTFYTGRSVVDYMNSLSEDDFSDIIEASYYKIPIGDERLVVVKEEREAKF